MRGAKTEFQTNCEGEYRDEEPTDDDQENDETGLDDAAGHNPQPDMSLHDSLKENWASQLEGHDLYTGIIRVDLENRTVEFAPKEESGPQRQLEAVSFTDVSETLLKEIARKAGPRRGNVLEMPISRLDHSRGELAAVGIPVNDFNTNNLPHFSEAMEDLSLDAQLTWTAADLALSTMEKIQDESGPPRLMSGYGPQLQEIRAEIWRIIEEVESTTDAKDLHDDHTYTIALRTEAMLDLVESRFEFSVYTQRDMTMNNIDTLRVACLKRKEFLASLEGDDQGAQETQATLAEARARMEQSSDKVRRSSFITAFTQA